jgi:hypothetical protein
MRDPERLAVIPLPLAVAAGFSTIARTLDISVTPIHPLDRREKSLRSSGGAQLFHQAVHPPNNVTLRFHGQVFQVLAVYLTKRGVRIHITQRSEKLLVYLVAVRGVIERNTEEEVHARGSAGSFLGEHLVVRLDVRELGIGWRTNHALVRLALSPQLCIHLVVDVVEPFLGISVRRILLHELARTLAAKTAGEGIFHRA